MFLFPALSANKGKEQNMSEPKQVFICSAYKTNFCEEGLFFNI